MFKAFAALLAALATLVGMLVAIAVVVVAINSGAMDELFEEAGSGASSSTREDELVSNVLGAMHSGNPFEEAAARSDLSAHQNGSQDFSCQAYDRRDRKVYSMGTPDVGGRDLPSRDSRNTASYWHGQQRDAYGNLIDGMNGNDRSKVNENYDRYSDSWQELDHNRRATTRW